MEDFLPLQLGRANVILRMKWLKTLGEMVNWKLLWIPFKVGGSTVTLLGDPSLSISFVSLEAMVRAIKNEGEGFLVELGSMIIGDKQSTLACEKATTIPTPLARLIQQHQGMCDWPETLPSHWSHNHAIELQLGMALVSIQMYCYPQIHKDEIEKLVKDMLVAGVIHLSSNPFSSSVLLVKKKEDSL